MYDGIMRPVFTVLAAIALLAGPALASDTKLHEGGDTIPTAQLPRLPPAQIRADQLDRLFARLVKAHSAEEAAPAEASIWRLWMTSDSATAELLLAQAVEASAAQQNQIALDILNKLIDVHPDFMEAWNRRATVYFLLGKYDQSVSDIDHVLEAEPRHFGALSGLGMIKRQQGDLAAARGAFSDALAVNPTMEGVKRALEEIEKEDRPI
ncbi:tetratricopeptide repeat protein [soil metagenome]